MKCEQCGTAMEMVEGYTYHFEKNLSGLDNVYLENMTVDKCPECGNVSPYFYQSPKLLRAVALAVVMQPVPLNKDDLKFLRKERGLKAKDFAALLRVDVSTYSRWESGDQQLGSQSDTLVRTVYELLVIEETKQPMPLPLTKRIPQIMPDREKDFAIYVDAKAHTFNYKNVPEFVA